MMGRTPFSPADLPTGWKTKESSDAMAGGHVFCSRMRGRLPQHPIDHGSVLQNDHSAPRYRCRQRSPGCLLHQSGTALWSGCAVLPGADWWRAGDGRLKWPLRPLRLSSGLAESRPGKRRIWRRAGPRSYIAGFATRKPGASVGKGKLRHHGRRRAVGRLPTAVGRGRHCFGAHHGFRRRGIIDWADIASGRHHGPASGPGVAVARRAAEIGSARWGSAGGLDG
jgi:hypothetical protein